MNSEIEKFNHWLNTEFGQQLLQWQTEQYQAIVPDVLGTHALQFGLPQNFLLKSSSICHKFILCSCFSDEFKAVDAHKIIAESVAWPIANESIDLVLLPLTLNNSLDLPSTIREAHRVLRPHGRLLICANNILSIWGIARQYRYFRQLVSKQAPNSELLQTWVTPWHLKNWLHALNFQITQINTGVHSLPFNSQWLQKNTKWLSPIGNTLWPIFAAAYFIDANKRQIAPIMWRPKWHNIRQNLNITNPASTAKANILEPTNK